MPRLRPILAALTTGVLLLAACAGDDAPDATTDLEVTGTDALEFEPDSFAVPAGQEVTVRFTAEEAVEHDLVIEGAAMHGMVGEEGHGDHDDHAMEGDDLHVAHADAGQTVTATFMIDEPGSYEVYCSVPGHREAGMVATLTVVAEG
jgi:uncharacterized cupredoxin-like copper-binding protein